MTVKCLKPTDKQDIALFYRQGNTVEELTALYGRSPRTIKRVLQEQGVEPVWQRKPKPQTVPALKPPTERPERSFFGRLHDFVSQANIFKANRTHDSH